MWNIYIISSFLGALGVSLALVINLPDSDETVSEIIVTEQQQLEFVKPREKIDSLFDQNPNLTVNQATINDAATHPHIAPTSEYLVDNITTIDIVEPENIEPFLGYQVELKYQEFIDQLHSDASLTEEQIQTFFKRLLATIETSDEARVAIARAYRDTQDDDLFQRSILNEMLMKSDSGINILLTEAKYILDNGQQERFSDMFQIYQNPAIDMSSQILDQALMSASTSTDIQVTANAINYIGRLETSKDLSPVYASQAISTLEHIAIYNENEDISSLATQKLYRLLGPERSSTVAQYHIDNNTSTPLVITTLNSIIDGDIALTPDLQNSLTIALKREDLNLSPEERAQGENILSIIEVRL